MQNDHDLHGFIKELSECEQRQLFWDFPDSDYGNAQRIQMLYGERLLYCYGNDRAKRGWYVRSNDGRWTRDTRDMVFRLALNTMQQFASAEREQDLSKYFPREAKRMSEFPYRSATLAGIKRALKYLQLELTAPDGFDPDARDAA